MQSGDDTMMLAVLALLTILAIWGTVKNKRANNFVGAVIGGAMSFALVAISLLAFLIDFGIIKI